MLFQIMLLALGAAVFPALLACVAILISRPNPRRLLLAFYVGGMIASIVSGFLVLTVFAQSDNLSQTSSSPNTVVAIGGGIVGLLFAWLLITNKGHDLLDRWKSHIPKRKKPKEEGPSWIELRLNNASVRMALIVGAAINLPGPFYLIALGDIHAANYNPVVAGALVIFFNLVMFILVEVPLVGYLINPVATEERVSRFATWLNHNGLRVMGCLVAVFSIAALVQGIATVV